MAFFFRSLVWLTVLGGAAAGIGLPTNNAVRSVINKNEIRKSGWNSSAGQDYESYWYGKNGFGDARTKAITNGNWSGEFNTALSDIRTSWGKQNVGKGLEKGFKSWLETKQNICKNGDSGSNGCYVGNIEFIDNKGETLFGRIPVKDSSGNHNLYVRWQKCKEHAKASAIWKGFKRSESSSSSLGVRSTGTSSNSNYNWCFQSAKAIKGS